MPIEVSNVPVNKNSNIANILNFKPPVISHGALTKRLSFDDPGIVDGTIVNSVYAASGVSLAKLSVPTTTTGIVFPDPNSHDPVYARAYHSAQAKNHNLISIVPNTSSDLAHPTNPGFDESIGVIQVKFTKPVKFVSVLAIGILQSEIAVSSNAQVYARAFDNQGNLLHESNYPRWDPKAVSRSPGFGAWLQLGYTSLLANIRYLLLSSTVPATGGQVYAAFDTLMFY